MQFNQPNTFVYPPATFQTQMPYMINSTGPRPMIMNPGVQLIATSAQPRSVPMIITIDGKNVVLENVPMFAPQLQSTGSYPQFLSTGAGYDQGHRTMIAPNSYSSLKVFDNGKIFEAKDMLIKQKDAWEEASYSKPQFKESLQFQPEGNWQAIASGEVQHQDND